MTPSRYVALIVVRLASTCADALVLPGGSGSHSAFVETVEVGLSSFLNKTAHQIGDALTNTSAVVRHYKRRGGGYEPYSPLYEKAVVPPQLSPYWCWKVLAWEGSLISFICFTVAFLIWRNERKPDRLKACRIKDEEVEEEEEGNTDIDDLDRQGSAGSKASSIKLSRCETGMTMPSEDELERDFFSMEPDELADTMGLSGMALLSMSANAGVSGLNYHTLLPLCALQAWILQGTILFYMARRITRLSGYSPEDEEKDVPSFIVFAAIYLHFINCINDLPYSLSLVAYVRDLHPKMFEFCIALPVFVVDGFVVPFTSLSVGALYLCTSLSVSDVILNSCAVAFIGNIDNWILSLNEKLNKSANVDAAGDLKVCVPVNKALMKNMSWWLCVAPVVPSIFSWFFCYVGLTYMQL